MSKLNHHEQFIEYVLDSLTSSGDDAKRLAASICDAFEGTYAPSKSEFQGLAANIDSLVGKVLSVKTTPSRDVEVQGALRHLRNSRPFNDSCVEGILDVYSDIERVVETFRPSQERTNVARVTQNLTQPHAGHGV